MTFWDHLEVFRGAALRIVGVLLVLMVGTFTLMTKFYDPFVLGPTTDKFFLYRLLPNFHGEFHVDIININVASQFLTHVSTSFWFALVLAFPYVIWEIWRFVSPALYNNEKRPVRFAFLFGTGMFYLGCAVGYCVVFPFTFRFLTEYQLSADIVNQISLNSYMSNFLTLVFVMGLVFEMPLLIWLLSNMGIIDKSFLRKYRRHAIVILVILAAIITPSGDPFTLTVVFTPLYLLYELGILLARKPDPEDDDDTPTDNTPVPTTTAPISQTETATEASEASETVEATDAADAEELAETPAEGTATPDDTSDATPSEAEDVEPEPYDPEAPPKHRYDPYAN